MNSRLTPDLRWTDFETPHPNAQELSTAVTINDFATIASNIGCLGVAVAGIASRGPDFMSSPTVISTYGIFLSAGLIANQLSHADRRRVSQKVLTEYIESKV